VIASASMISISIAPKMIVVRMDSRMPKWVSTHTMANVARRIPTLDVHAGRLLDRVGDQVAEEPDGTGRADDVVDQVAPRGHEAAPVAQPAVAKE